MTDPPQTPRLSGAWRAQVELAEALSARLRARELEVSAVGPALDVRHASMLRALRNAVDYWASRFARWPTDGTLTLEQKVRDHREWSLLIVHVLAVLEPR